MSETATNSTEAAAPEPSSLRLMVFRTQRLGMRAGVALLLSMSGCAAGVPVGAKGQMVLSGYRGRPLLVASRSSGKPARPAPASARATVAARAAGKATSHKAQHVVAKGETLWRISQRYGVTVTALKAANGIDDPTMLQAGVRLSIPGSGAIEKGTARTPAPAKRTKPKLAPAKVEKKSSRPAPAKKAKPTKKTGGYPLLWPVAGEVTSRFGKRWGRAHDGIDIGAAAGSTVRAAANGVVMFSAEHGSYGNLVILKHGGGLVTVYAHNQINLVRKGQQVKAGQMIAKVGQTGRASGPHLHFEVRKGAKPQNPMGMLPP